MSKKIHVGKTAAAVAALLSLVTAMPAAAATSAVTGNTGNKTVVLDTFSGASPLAGVTCYGKAHDPHSSSSGAGVTAKFDIWCKGPASGVVPYHINGSLRAVRDYPTPHPPPTAYHEVAAAPYDVEVGINAKPARVQVPARGAEIVPSGGWFVSSFSVSTDALDVAPQQEEYRSRAVHLVAPAAVDRV